MKIATTAPQPSSAHPTSLVMAPLFIRSRIADTTWETGLTVVTVRSHPGSVSTGTNALERNPNGNMIIMDMPWTAPAVPAIVPIHRKIQVNASR